LTWRRVRRAVALAIVLAAIVVSWWWRRLRRRTSLCDRAKWLQRASQGVLRCLGVAIEVGGHVPARGLVVANHLSYFDILIISAAMPCFFVSKKEIAGWPYFGWAARTGGTIFLDRKSMRSARHVAGEIEKRLDAPIPVLLFPEGTSTEGKEVLRFHSRLIDPAVRAGAPIAALAIRYVVDGGLPEREVCFFGNAALLPHAWRVMVLKGFTAQLRFGEARVYSDRRAAAEQTRTEVVAMREVKPRAVE
jgi:lyso-ornithine lipid O-acyltransferase